MSNTDVEALKGLYERMGGVAEDVENTTTTVEMLKNIYALQGGEDDVSKINTSSDMIDKLLGAPGGSSSGANIKVLFDQTIDLVTMIDNLQDGDLRPVVENGKTKYYIKLGTVNGEYTQPREYINDSALRAMKPHTFMLTSGDMDENETKDLYDEVYHWESGGYCRGGLVQIFDDDESTLYFFMPCNSTDPSELKNHVRSMTAGFTIVHVLLYEIDLAEINHRVGTL